MHIFIKIQPPPKKADEILLNPHRLFQLTCLQNNTISPKTVSHKFESCKDNDAYSTSKNKACQPPPVVQFLNDCFIFVLFTQDYSCYLYIMICYQTIPLCRQFLAPCPRYGSPQHPQEIMNTFPTCISL